MSEIEDSLSAIKKIEGVDSIILVEKVGLAAESFLPKDKDTAEISAMAASLWGLGEFFIKRLGSGKLECISVESKRSKILTFPFEGKVLVISTKKDVATEELNKKLASLLSV